MAIAIVYYTNSANEKKIARVEKNESYADGDTMPIDVGPASDALTTYTGTVKTDINEPAYDGNGPVTMTDNTVRNNNEEYLAHLEQYIP